MEFSRLIPELTVTNIEVSKHFYIDLCGFQLEYERRDDKFAFLSLEGSQIMIEEMHVEAWNVGELKYPFGRGINLSIEVNDIDALYKRLTYNCCSLYRKLMLNKYESNGDYIEQREFLVQDPDGYLLRFTHEQMMEEICR